MDTSLLGCRTPLRVGDEVSCAGGRRSATAITDGVTQSRWPSDHIPVPMCTTATDGQSYLLFAGKNRARMNSFVSNICLSWAIRPK